MKLEFYLSYTSTINKLLHGLQNALYDYMSVLTISKELMHLCCTRTDFRPNQSSFGPWQLLTSTVCIFMHVYSVRSELILRWSMRYGTGPHSNTCHVNTRCSEYVTYIETHTPASSFIIRKCPKPANGEGGSHTYRDMY